MTFYDNRQIQDNSEGPAHRASNRRHIERARTRGFPLARRVGPALGLRSSTLRVTLQQSRNPLCLGSL